WLAEKRDFFGGYGGVEVTRQYVPVNITVDQRGGGRQRLVDLCRTLGTRRGKREHISSFIVNTGELQADVIKKEMVRSRITQQRASLKGACASFERERIGAAGQVQLCDLKRAA